VTAKQRVVIIPGDQPGYGGKEFEKRKVLRWEQEWKTKRKGQQRFRIRAWRWRRAEWWWWIEL